MSDPSQPPVPPNQEGSSEEQAQAVKDVVDRFLIALLSEETIAGNETDGERAQAVKEVVDQLLEALSSEETIVEEVVEQLLKAVSSEETIAEKETDKENVETPPIISPEEEETIDMLLLLPEEGTTEEERFGRKFQLMHLRMFFLVSLDAHNRGQRTLPTYGHTIIARAYNFRTDPIYQSLEERNFDPKKYIFFEKDRNVKLCRKYNDTLTRSKFVRTYRFCHALEELLGHPTFKTYAKEYAALSQHLVVCDEIEKQKGNKVDVPGVRKLYWEMMQWMFEYFKPRIAVSLDKRIPGKQWTSERKFFHARKEYYMMQPFDLSKGALVAYCYHILAMYIEKCKDKEANLMLLVFFDLRKIKVKLQGNAKELDKEAAKALTDAEYDSLSKILRIYKWESHIDLN